MGCRRSRLSGSRGVRGSESVWNLGVWGLGDVGCSFSVMLAEISDTMFRVL